MHDNVHVVFRYTQEKKCVYNHYNNTYDRLLLRLVQCRIHVHCHSNISVPLYTVFTLRPPSLPPITRTSVDDKVTAAVADRGAGRSLM